MVKSVSVIALGAFALVLAVGGPAKAGPSAGVKCEVGKKKATCKKVCCELGIKAKGGTDVTKCSAGFSKAFTKLDAKAAGACSSSDTGAIEAKVDAFVTDALSELKPVSAKCEVSKIKATCKKVCCELALEAKAELKGGTDDEAVDFTKCKAQFSATFTKADATKGGCATSSDAGAIESKVDAFVDDVVDELTGQ